MAAFYRKALKTMYENLPEDMIFQDIHRMSIMKLLVHFALVTDLKAKRKQGDTETEKIPDNWYRPDDRVGLDHAYIRNGRIYHVYILDLSSDRDEPERNGDLPIMIHHREAQGTGTISIFTDLPGNCSEERARIDEERIKDVISEIVTGLRDYMENIESGNFTPAIPFPPNNDQLQ
ncbi:uncharacterized protein LOC135848992 isoform X1 [Planococcus citri]|uniref:uncharacterized protein LOC135848992 isoform X1 n=1 Tax=Planococcus citri TaxID=170843 RepID=UPI0031F7DF12